ncbi:MAG: GIY-YIG nuclease family protein [Patescibacteria group bacterium]
MYQVYAIYNREHDKIYVGQTTNIEERLIQHNQHILEGFTSRYTGDWILIYQETAESRRAAIVRERQLKSYRGRQFIKQFIPR